VVVEVFSTSVTHLAVLGVFEHMRVADSTKELKILGRELSAVVIFMFAPVLSIIALSLYSGISGV